MSGRSGHDELAVGCDGGSIQVHKLQFQHITAIYEVRQRKKIASAVVLSDRW